jgi:hypothetical protein
VRENLFRFLRAFRSRYQSQIIWLDAVCINQDDIQERSHQVQSMRQIYSGAKCVYSWLGYDKPLPHTGILNRQRAIDMYYWYKKDKRRYTRYKDRLEYIVQSEYWSRMWIVQEFFLAKDVILLAGKDKLSYDKFESIMEYGYCFEDVNTIKQCKTYRLMDLRESWRSQSTVLFEDLFEAFSMLPCSIPLDGVFALLGLVGKKREEELRLVGLIDYSLTVWQLLQLILALHEFESSPFKFIEQYNRYLIKGQQDDSMGGYVGLEFEEFPPWPVCGPDDSRYSSIDGLTLHMAMSMRASRAIRYQEATDCETIEIAMYTPKWRTISGQSGVSVSPCFNVEQPRLLGSLHTCILIEACDSHCTTTCATHAILGFSWTFCHAYRRSHDPAPMTSIDVPLLARNASRIVSQLIRSIQQQSMEMVEALSSKVRLGVVEQPRNSCTSVVLYKLETDVETIVRLSTFIRYFEQSDAWPEFLELAMERLQKPGTGEQAASPG